MADQHHLRYFLDIPLWYILFEEEIARYNTYILECNGAVDQVMFYISMDCSAFCMGCIFCDNIEPVCVCVHTQHTEAIKLQLNQNHPPMTQGKPTTPATADQYINDVFIKNNKQQTHRRPGQICQVCTHGETHKFISNF